MRRDFDFTARGLAEERLLSRSTNTTYQWTQRLIIFFVVIGAITVGTRVGSISILIGFFLIIIVLPVITYKVRQSIPRQDIEREITKMGGKEGVLGKEAFTHKPLYKTIAIVFISIFLLLAISLLFT